MSFIIINNDNDKLFFFIIWMAGLSDFDLPAYNHFGFCGCLQYCVRILITPYQCRFQFFRMILLTVN